MRIKTSNQLKTSLKKGLHAISFRVLLLNDHRIELSNGEKAYFNKKKFYNRELSLFFTPTSCDIVTIRARDADKKCTYACVF